MAGFIAFLIIQLIGVWIYFNKKTKSTLETTMKNVITKDTHDLFEEKVNNRIEKLEICIHALNLSSEKTSTKLDNIECSIDSININIAEIKTFLKGKINGSS